MSTAERRGRRRIARSRQGGHTFLEVMTSILIVSLMALVIERTLAAAHETERYLGGIRKVAERGQRVAYDIRQIVSSSRKLYQGDDVGLNYLAALDLYNPTPAIAASRLPMFDETGGIGPDAPGDPRTGNTLLFVRESDAAPAVADTGTNELRYIDTYRFVCVYVAETQRYLVEEANRKKARDLIFWRSVAYPSHGQILSVSDPVKRVQVVKDLYDRFGYEYCWDANAPVEQAFYAIDSLGNVNPAPTPGVVIDMDPDTVERGRLVYANVQLARTDPSSHDRRSVFTVDDPSSWVPDGFEVKIVGTSGSRKVWINLVIETQAAKGRVPAHTSTVIASTRDL